jgi:hypothetical protein
MTLLSTRAARALQVRNTIAAAAFVGVVAAALAPSAARGAYSDVTSLRTTTLAGPASARSAAGDGNADNFPSSNIYNMTFGGATQRVDSFTTKTGNSYFASDIADLVIRRNRGSNSDSIWYRGTGNSDTPNLNLRSKEVGDVATAFGGNNLLVGADNIFANTGDPKGNNVNIERLDFIFSGGFGVKSGTGLTVFDRGLADDHDAFKIVAITGMGADGRTPTNFGTPVLVQDGTWGKTDVVPKSNTIVMRRDLSSTANKFRPSDAREQPLGGVYVPLTDLAQAGQTIYGYALLSPDTTGSGTQLNDWRNATYYPTNTKNDLDDRAGGLDPIGITAVVFGPAVPEPTGLIALVLPALLLGRRRRR